MVAIIGSVVGSLVIVVVIVGFVLYKRRQHRLRAKGLDEESSQGSGDEDEDYEIKGSPPSSPRLGPLSAGDNYARSPQVVPIGVEQPESQTLTLADEKSGVGFVNLNGGRDQRSPQDHERKDQLDRVLQMHREQLYQLQELLKQHQMTNPRSHSAPHTLMDDGEGKEEGRPVWQSPSPFSRRGEPQGDGNTETPLSGSVPGSETSSLYRSESTTPMTSSAVTVVSGLEIEYLDGKILVDDEDELRDLLKSFAEINARYDQQIQRIQEGL
ncbi:hypothetical protein BGX33_001793 [Mortierella sp. NVP41]|nr:hypothetical protein BGX33_001793 [Mortierella sp. NVP41]